MGKRSRQPVAATLGDRFRFDEDSIRVGGRALESRLRSATDLETGERHLVRLFPKTGTAIDQDLRTLVDGGLRRIRRVLSSRRAREVLVQVVEVVEDERELGIVMLDPGVPLLSSPRRAQARRELCMTNVGRRDFWRNVSRVVEALTYCHDGGIMHGAIDEHTIFAGDERSPSYRLGGYEACVHFADEDLSPSEMALRKASSISFRQDLADLARVVRSALGLGLPEEPVLTSIERRMLSRMAEPPQFQLYDAHAAFKEMSEVVEELDRLGSSAEGELVLYPSPEVLRSDLASLASGAILADDVDAILGFVAEDLLRADTYAAVDGPRTLRVATGLAVYSVEIGDGRAGAIVRCARRRPDDALAEAFEIKRRIHLARNRGAAMQRVRNLGNGAMSWAGLRKDPSATASAEDPPSWYALILLEAFSLLRQQFRTYPVEVLVPPRRSELVWIAPRPDENREAQRARLKMPSLAGALHQEMRYDEGRPDWTVSISDALGRPRERLPELSLERIAEIEGVRAYGFRSSEPVLPDQDLFLRPRTEAGTEGAIRRRLQNVVAARTNFELLRALDDPATVPMDEALRVVAAPGEPPENLDQSKKEAWASIAVGRSVNVVVGPPGVGKTYLVARLIESILANTASARILVSSQNHDTLVSIEHELKGVLTPLGKIVVRVQKTDVETGSTLLRA